MYQEPIAIDNQGRSTNLLNNNAWDILDESADLFFKSLQLGRVRGLVSIMDLPNSGENTGSEYIALTRELIRRDLLVTIYSSGTMDLSTAGMTGPDIFQAAGDGLAEFCDFIGIPPVLCIHRGTDESDILNFYTGLAQCGALTPWDLPLAEIAPGPHQRQTEGPGMVFTMEDGPAKTADRIDEYIHHKRLKALWCDRCGGLFSPFS